MRVIYEVMCKMLYRTDSVTFILVLLVLNLALASQHLQFIDTA